MQKITAAFIIRFHYKVDDPRFEWRFAFFRDHVLPRILANGEGFDIAIWCNRLHADRFRKLSPRIITFFVKKEHIRYKIGREGARYFVDFTPWKNVVGLPKYDVQMGLDSDDLIGTQYVRRIMLEIEQRPPEKSLHISFQPRLTDVATGKVHLMQQQYHPKKGSAFFALYQPNKQKYIFAYEDSHLKLWRYADESITIPDGFCSASCHHLNESTHI